MLTTLEQTQQKWGGSNKLIDQWLNNRRVLLVQYCKIAGLAPYESPGRTLPELEEVKTFCDLLVDYVSEGHFEIYDQVVSTCENISDECKARAHLVIPRISKTTDAALDFNDKYSEAKDEELLYDLDKDLGALMEAMESRFEQEDTLLEIVYTNVAEPAAVVQ
ncbi:sigma D regulator [Shewanella corallii]|uniref:Sigma D regulator n=2 Tax=Shewanella TaxID=22 RepID=A0ABT0N887_9GAMM|nr:MULTISPECIES: sigma D regulator [Shewanella]MCL1038300.1 sigma D regulator [Shewanella submarina]MCL2914683.1 sigma D regulator [Shewanella corallii]